MCGLHAPDGYIYIKEHKYHSNMVALLITETQIWLGYFYKFIKGCVCDYGKKIHQ